MKLLYNEKELSCIKTEFLHFKFTLLLAILDVIGSKLVSNYLNFSVEIPVDIQLETFLLLSNIKELSIGEKTEKFW